MMDPKEIVKLCSKKGIDTISITDHNTINGSLAAKKFSQKYNVNIVIGVEFSTNAGDIIGLGISEEIRSTNYFEVIEQVHSQGGLCVLPHPYRGHKMIDELARLVDVIEIWNARSTAEQNKHALLLSHESTKPVTAGSDAHLYTELGHVLMNTDGIFDNNKTYQLKYSSHREKNISYIIRDIKLKKYKTLPYHMLRLIF